MTPDQFKQYVQDASLAADAVLPLVGDADIVPLVAAGSALLQKLADVYQARQNPGDAAIAASMAAARLAAEASALAKFGSGK